MFGGDRHPPRRLCAVHAPARSALGMSRTAVLAADLPQSAQSPHSKRQLWKATRIARGISLWTAAASCS